MKNWGDVRQRERWRGQDAMTSLKFQESDVAVRLNSTFVRFCDELFADLWLP